MGFGIGALVCAILAIGVPLYGFYVSGLAIVLAVVAALNGDKIFATSATVIAGANTIFLSPLFMAVIASTRASGEIYALIAAFLIAPFVAIAIGQARGRQPERHTIPTGDQAGFAPPPPHPGRFTWDTGGTYSGSNFDTATEQPAAPDPPFWSNPSPEPNAARRKVPQINPKRLRAAGMIALYALLPIVGVLFIPEARQFASERLTEWQAQASSASQAASSFLTKYRTPVTQCGLLLVLAATFLGFFKAKGIPGVIGCVALGGFIVWQQIMHFEFALTPERVEKFAIPWKSDNINDSDQITLLAGRVYQYPKPYFDWTYRVKIISGFIQLSLDPHPPPCELDAKQVTQYAPDTVNMTDYFRACGTPIIKEISRGSL